MLAYHPSRTQQLYSLFLTELQIWGVLAQGTAQQQKEARNWFKENVIFDDTFVKGFIPADAFFERHATREELMNLYNDAANHVFTLKQQLLGLKAQIRQGEDETARLKTLFDAKPVINTQEGAIS